jgi:A/G-specific adenine glycosylase
MKLTTAHINDFQKTVLDYFSHHQRELPWRKTNDPYAILVSEIMLQQTQVPRVIEKYLNWIQHFPSVFDLAKADFNDILPYWVGLGYNRRALYLKRSADDIVTHHRGIYPTSPEGLMKLPGVGSYTARAICVFAYNQPHILVETNTRTVFIHHFFADKSEVEDHDIIPLIEQTMDLVNPRQWFSALFDYGSFLKTQFPNPTRKSKQYSKQSPLKGSVREVRGHIMKLIALGVMPTRLSLLVTFPEGEDRIDQALAGLKKDGLLSENFRVEEAGEG